MVTIEDALDYIGIDYADEKVRKNVLRALESAKEIVYGAVGYDVEVYLPNDSRTAELILIYTDDLYSERGVNAKVSNAVRLSVGNMELQLKLDLRRSRREANEV